MELESAASFAYSYNASGCTLSFSKQGPNWHGHMYKYPPDTSILNGQWSVFLHVKTAGAAAGSQSCVIYSIEEEGADVFLGWMVPWNQSSWSCTVYADVNKKGHWPDDGSWKNMEKKVNDSSKRCTNSYGGKTARLSSDASIGDDTSPQVNYVISAE